MQNCTLSCRWLYSVLVALIAAIITPPTYAQQQPSNLLTTFGADGVSSLKWQDAEMISDGRLSMLDLRFGAQGAIGEEFSPRRTSFDSRQATARLDFVWGSIQVTYRPLPDRLVMELSARNSGRRDITALTIRPLQIRLPQVPDARTWQNRYPMRIESSNSIPFLLADFKSGKLALCGDDVVSNPIFSFMPIDSEPWAIWINLANKPIKPGETRHATLSLRLADADTPSINLVSDVCKTFAQRYPFTLDWPDRRPIGSAFLSTSQAGYPHNPRGWFFDPELNTSTPQGRATFRKKLMAYADECIRNSKRLNAQGIIIWDLEGQQMPHATSYIADPRALSRVAPEMDAVADEFFKKLSGAGLRTGLTVRPTRIEPADDGWTQKDVSDQFAEIDSKIEYARKRWGCTIFYIDSNVDFIRDETGRILSDPAMSAEGMEKLARKYKGCLLIPEHETDRYWASLAPYNELRLGIGDTPDYIRRAYPEACSVIRVVDGPPLSDPAIAKALVRAIHNGDILLFRPWWNDPQTDDIVNIYAQAAQSTHESD